MPEISIVLPTYNGEKYIRESIDSVLAQTFTDWELIIVDDCSTDSTPEIIKEYAERDERIRIIHNEKNLKLPTSLNVGFREAKGKYYTWTSDDNVYEACALEEMRNYLIKNPEDKMVVGHMVCIDECGAYASELDGYNEKVMGYANCVGACFLYEAGIVSEVGGYNPEWFLVEDYEYWLRILFCIGEIGYLDKILYKYRLHRDSLTGKKAVEIQKQLFRLRVVYLEKLLHMLQDDEELIFKMYYEMLEVQSLSEEQKSIFAKYCPLLQGAHSFDAANETIIYGAGKYGKKLCEFIPNIVKYVDQNDVIVGTRFKDIEVISIKELLQAYCGYQLVIAVNDSIIYSVARGLNGLGVENFCTLRDVLKEKNVTYNQFIED